VLFAKGFGVASVETQAPVTPEMLFRLGSTTKMFVGAALAGLAEEGKLRLDRPIGEYVQGLHPSISRLTAHQLMTHTAGLADETAWYGSHDDAALGEGIRAWTEKRFFTEPGRTYRYSNPGYWLAGYLVEVLSGRPFADAMAERLFRPLGMTSTTFRPTVAMTHPLAVGHEAAEGKESAVVRPMADNAATWPAGSMFSSVRDLSRFVLAFLNGGGPGLFPAVIARLSTPHVGVPGESARHYGYGLNVRERRGIRLLEHNGNRLGYGSSIRMAPDHRIGVIVAANRTGVSLPKSTEKAMELLLPAPAAGER
jgi:CubicO group peptidase (beta-lactamase class C family)